MSTGFSLLVDGLLAVLLLTTLVYVARLNRRLGQIRDARQEFEGLIARFAEATEQADRSIAGVKAAAAAEGKELQAAIERGRGLREDLAFLADKASGVADHLEAAIARSRKGPAARVSPSGSEERPAPFRRPEAERGPGQAQGLSQGSARAASRGTPQGTPQGTPHGTPQGTPHGTPQGTLRGEPMSAGERDLLAALSAIR